MFIWKTSGDRSLSLFSLLRPPHNKTYRRRKQPSEQNRPHTPQNTKKPQEHLLRSAQKVSRDDWIRPPIGRSGDARSEANDIYLSPQPPSTEYQPSRELSRPSTARCFVVGWARSSLLRPPHNKTCCRRKTIKRAEQTPHTTRHKKKPQEHLLRSAQKS